MERIDQIINSLAMAFGGLSQVSPRHVGEALAGQTNNNGLFSVDAMQYYDASQKQQFESRIAEGIRIAATIYDTETEDDSVSEIRAAFDASYDVPAVCC